MRKTISFFCRAVKRNDMNTIAFAIGDAISVQ